MLGNPNGISDVLNEEECREQIRTRKGNKGSASNRNKVKSDLLTKYLFRFLLKLSYLMLSNRYCPRH